MFRVWNPVTRQVERATHVDFDESRLAVTETGYWLSEATDNTGDVFDAAEEPHNHSHKHKEHHRTRPSPNDTPLDFIRKTMDPTNHFSAGEPEEPRDMRDKNGFIAPKDGFNEIADDEVLAAAVQHIADARCHQAAEKIDDYEPLAYEQAMAGPCAKQWQEAMDNQMTSFKTMETWKLVGRPPQSKQVVMRLSC